MPIEIKELHIRVSVSPPEGERAPAGSGGRSGENGDTQKQLVAECVEQVMQVLRDQRER